MRFKYTINPRKSTLFLGIVSLYLAVQSLIGEYLLENVLSSETDSLIVPLLDLFSVNAEETIPTWYSTLLLFFGAALLAFIAAVKQKNREPYRHRWTGLALIFLYLSMDEGAVIHEIFADPLQETFNTTGYLAFSWQIVFVPLVIFFALFYLRFLFHLPPSIRNLFIIAGSLYVGGAVVVEAISANRWYQDGGVSFPYLAIGTVEETFEMLGVVVFIFALLSYIVAIQYTAVIDFSPPTQLALPAANHLGVKQFTSQKWLLTGVFVLIIGLNLGLYAWASGQQFDQAAVDPRTIPFYQTVTDRYAGQGVIILGINEVIEPGNPAAQKIASSLLTLFNDVIVVTMPESRTSIAFAGHDLPFGQNALREILHQSGEDVFTILGISDVRTLAVNNSTEP